MAEFDLVLKGGVIYDGSGASPMRGDVGIRGTRVAGLGANLSGEDVIDCTGLCLAPGFIDTHSCSDLAALADPGLEMKVRQGVTLEIIGQNGLSVAPLRAGDVESRRAQLQPLLGSPNVDWSWRSVANYLDALDLARPALDLAFLVPHGAIRESIIGLTDSRAADHDVFRMKGLLARSLDEGAYGLSIGLPFVPCFHAELGELAELAGVAASRQVPCVVHLRSESEGLLEALEEVFKVGRDSGADLHVSHLKIAGNDNWPLVDKVIEAFTNARREGLRVSADLYPYPAGSSNLSDILPPWAREGGLEQALARLGDAATRARIRAEILDTGRCLWDNLWKSCGPDKLVIWDLPSGQRPETVGKDLAFAAKSAGADPVDFALDLLRSERLNVPVATFNQNEEIIERLLQQPFVNLCSASLPAARPHPRTYGAFPRVLARYVRERRTLTLEAAVRKMSGLAADTFGLNDYGYILEGKRASIVAFDPDKVQDLATFEKADRYPAGIPHVVVNGKAVIRDGQTTGERPGRVARHKRS
ncbi:MAG: N-acyl-D-amino-acid deacylase family protein [Myxococcales bacterium]|jgi:N-acyl-D-amino-acid deacylase